ncbi:MAG TPA: hypothetical protein VFG68_03845 [Fimbriiglobus sp.]|nr:hypothetical protein [Fimbriiglobus sp.]
MSTHITLVFLVACLLASCAKTNRPADEAAPTSPRSPAPLPSDAKTYRPADGTAPALAVHLVVSRAVPGALEFLADSTLRVGLPDGRTLYYFPDRQLTGVRVESVSTWPTWATNFIQVQLAAAERDRLRAFAAAYPKAANFGLRFESTPAVPEPGGGVTRGAVIVQVFKMSDLTDDGRLRFSRPTLADVDGLARRLVGR